MSEKQNPLAKTIKNKELLKIFDKFDNLKIICY